jgi:predicted GNAT family acetyltransferase
MSDVTVSHHPDESRYEIHVDGKPAGLTQYRRTPGYVNFLHTEIDPAFEGQGLGGRLAAGALEDVRAGGDQVIATCPFIAAYIGRHPEYADLLMAD